MDFPVIVTVDPCRIVPLIVIVLFCLFTIRLTSPLSPSWRVSVIGLGLLQNTKEEEVGIIPVADITLISTRSNNTPKLENIITAWNQTSKELEKVTSHTKSPDHSKAENNLGRYL